MHRTARHLGNIGIFVLAAAFVYLAGSTLLAAWPMWSAMMGGSGLVPLLLWGGLLILVSWLLIKIFSGGRGRESSGVPGDSAEEILRERFARGEIDAEEYEESLEVLRSESATAESGGEELTAGRKETALWHGPKTG